MSGNLTVTHYSQSMIPGEFLTMRRIGTAFLASEFKVKISLEVKLSERLTAKTEECVPAVGGIVYLGLCFHSATH